MLACTGAYQLRTNQLQSANAQWKQLQQSQSKLEATASKLRAAEKQLELSRQKLAASEKTVALPKW